MKGKRESSALLAALIFFTRLPWWRIGTPSQAAFDRVPVYFPWVAWLTAAVFAFSTWTLNNLFPPLPAVGLALGVRLLFTGCLHEDALADFYDGFGGGRTRERILEIMKDSHIGTYGVIGLTLHIIILLTILTSFPEDILPWIIFAALPSACYVTTETLNSLPYARKREESKAKTVYGNLNGNSRLIAICGGMIPLIPLSGFTSPIMLIAILAPISGAVGLRTLMKKKIGGYTGDCAGAIALLGELSFYLAAYVLLKWS